MVPRFDQAQQIGLAITAQSLGTIAEHIDTLARLTGAPESFVLQVRELFSRKGIPLEADAAPYVEALEEAFVREERIRASSRRIALGSTSGTGTVPRPAPPGSGMTELPPSPSAKPRAVVMRQQSEDLPMVPGPSDLQ